MRVFCNKLRKIKIEKCENIGCFLMRFPVFITILSIERGK